MKKAMLILFFVLIPFSALYATSNGDDRYKFREYVSQGGYFSCLILEGWETMDKSFGMSQDEKKVYGIDIFGLGIGPRVSASVKYYAEGNLLHETADQFIRLHSQPALGFVPEGSEYGPVTETIVAGRKAKTFERKKIEFEDHVYNPVKGIYYTPLHPREFPVIERFFVIPAKESFYVLRYKAPPDAIKSLEDVFQRVLNSFEPLIK